MYLSFFFKKKQQFGRLARLCREPQALCARLLAELDTAQLIATQIGSDTSTALSTTTNSTNTVNNLVCI